MKLFLFALLCTACDALVPFQSTLSHEPQKVLTNHSSVRAILLSFPELYDSKGDLSPTNKLLLRWKNHLLGDGGVYFDQRPKSLRELNSHISVSLMNDFIHRYHDDEIKVEAAVISTCARFEVLVTMEMTSASLDIHSELVDSILRILSEQMVSFRCRTKEKKMKYFIRRLKYIMFKVIPFPPRDNQRRVYKDNFCLDWMPQIDMLKSDLSNTVRITNEVRGICRRLCDIAAGLDRPIFRPFSARDSHIVHQMKSSSEAIVRSKFNLIESSSTYCKILFDAALQSSKAARSSKVVPILDDLRILSRGTDYPIELSKTAAESAKILAIEPAVRNCYSKFQALERSNDVSYIRHLASEIVSQSGFRLESDECSHIRTILHKPTIDLRNGMNVTAEEVLHLVQNEVNKMIKV